MHGLGHETRLTRPAYILISSWPTSDKPAAIDVYITSPLKSSILSGGFRCSNKTDRGEEAHMSTHAMTRSALN